MNESEAKKEKPPEVTIAWIAERQGVNVLFNPDEIKSWEMLIAMFDMAKSWAEYQRNLARLQQQAQPKRGIVLAGRRPD